MIQPDHPTLSITRQCRLVSISQSSYYHEARGESAENLALMAMIDRQFLETPFYGARQMTWHLRAEGRLVNIKRVRRLMRLMGLMPIYRPPRTSIPVKGHKTYPYLLRGWRSSGPIRSGAPTSPTSHWRRASCTLSRSWTGGATRS
jgi:putative transposase